MPYIQADEHQADEDKAYQSVRVLQQAVSKMCASEEKYNQFLYRIMVLGLRRNIYVVYGSFF